MARSDQMEEMVDIVIGVHCVPAIHGVTSEMIPACVMVDIYAYRGVCNGLLNDNGAGFHDERAFFIVLHLTWWHQRAYVRENTP